MTDSSIADRFDERFANDMTVALAREPAEVPMGTEVFIAPDHPKLIHYVQEVLRPRFVEIGATDLIEADGNQFIARMGGGDGPALLIQVYTPVQHHNQMADPWSGKIAHAEKWGIDEPCVFGQGVSQNKAHQAIALGLLKLLNDHAVALRGTLYVAVNNEGRSSHACSEAILAALPEKPEFAILLTNTDRRISMGNRGRVDVNITLRGKAVHSSVPQTGLSAIDGASSQTFWRRRCREHSRS